jgi:hypothetical protein
MPKHAIAVLTLVVSLVLTTAANAHANYDNGNIAIIEDTAGLILPAEGMCDNMLFAQGLCVNHAANAFYQTHGDHYDALMLFTTKQLNPLFNVQMGFPVQTEIRGIGLEATSLFNPGQFGSAGRLLQCVKMGDLSALPENPKDTCALPPITAIELMAHETGHHWMSWVMLDLDDGRGPIGILRGFEGDSPNGHWSAWFNSRSVMYGGILTDNGDGTFTNTNGPRKYGQLDQYLMGLRSPEEVEDLWYIDVDSSVEGNPSMPGYPGTTGNYTGTRVNFTIDDIIRANGARDPATSPCHLKFGFALIHESGKPPFPAEIEKVERYRIAFEAWWPEGTDNRGSIDTRLDGCGRGTEECPGDESEQCGLMPDGDSPPDGDQECSQGQTRCGDATRVEICNELGQWESLTICEDGQTCNSGVCTNSADGDEPTDGDATSDGDQPEDGDDSKLDGDDGVDGDTPDGDSAIDGDAQQTLCTMGQLRCNADVRERCSATEVNWLIVEDCAENGQICTPEACIDDPDGSTGGCQSTAPLGSIWLALVIAFLITSRKRRKFLL